MLIQFIWINKVNIHEFYENWVVIVVIVENKAQINAIKQFIMHVIF